MMIFQAQAYIPKLLLIAIALLSISMNFRVASSTRVFVASICLCGIIGAVVGAINMNKNPLSGLTLFLVWPILSIPIIANAKTDDSFKYIFKALFYSHCFIVAYDLIFAITALMGISFPNIYPGVEYPFSIYSTSTRMNFTNLNSLTFSTPCLALLIFSDYQYGISKKWQYLVLILTLVLFVISGRRSVMLQIALMPFLAIFFQGSLNANQRQVFKKLLFGITLSIVLAILYVFLFQHEIFEGYLQEVLDAFDPTEEPVKFLQHYSLMDAFAEKPLFGHGLGAYFFDPGRNMYLDSMELQYQFTLARVGAVGFIFYLTGYWGLFFYAYKLSSIKRDKVLSAISFGYLFMLMSHATNPVLNNFDLMLSYFLILSRVNYLDSYGKFDNLNY